MTIPANATIVDTWHHEFGIVARLEDGTYLTQKKGVITEQQYVTSKLVIGVDMSIISKLKGKDNE